MYVYTFQYVYIYIRYPDISSKWIKWMRGNIMVIRENFGDEFDLAGNCKDL